MDDTERRITDLRREIGLLRAGAGYSNMSRW